MSLPNLSKLTHVDADASDTKRVKKSLLPCQPELVYQQDEFVNVESSTRLSGSSSHFRKEAISELNLSSFSSQQVVSKQEVDAFVRSTQADGNVQRVIEELYRMDGFESKSDDVRNDDYYVFTEAYSNNRARQYYLKTIRQSTVVTHIINSGHFWKPGPRQAGRDSQLDDIQEQDVAYTAGFLWTNTHPNWTWKSSSTRNAIVRCQIHLPAGMQVVVDRAPVYVQDCATPDDKKSAFPDVLIPPGKFKVTSVQRYVASEEDEQREPKRLSSRSIWSQEDYANYMLEDNLVFVDVKLEVESFWKLAGLQDAM